MDDVQCIGSESYLTNCSHTTNHDCDHSDDAGVSCEGDSQSMHSNKVLIIKSTCTFTCVI